MIAIKSRVLGLEIWACPDCLGDMSIPSLGNIILEDVRCIGCGQTIDQWEEAARTLGASIVCPLALPDAYNQSGADDLPLFAKDPFS